MKRVASIDKELEHVEFLDLFDLEMIQKLQDSFSSATGVASIITKPDGTPITKPSNFCRLCKDIIRKTELGVKNCYYSDSIIGRQNTSGPIFQNCLSGGLLDGGASISVGNKQIANWLIGQVKSEETHDEEIMMYADEIGADKEKFRNALSEVKIMSVHQFENIADSLFIFANQLSEKAYDNLQLKLNKDQLELLVQEKTVDLEAAIEQLRATNEDLSFKNNIIHEQNGKLKKALKRLKETQKQLIQSEKMASLGVLTAGIAHEINNPLNFLQGAYIGLENYFEEFGSEDENTTQLLLDSIKTGVERASKIVKGLNQFSRESTTLDEECNVHLILDNCLIMMFNQLRHRVVVLKDYCNESLIVKGNVGKLHQVFINVLSNAVYSIQDEGEIHIITKKEKENVIIEIIDNGMGISPQNISHVTEPFFTTKPPGDGTGLGLSISYSIIKEHQGIIEFESVIDKGTKVMIILPEKES